jgi:dienelactone hydrolase
VRRQYFHPVNKPDAVNRPLQPTGSRGIFFLVLLTFGGLLAAEYWSPWRVLTGEPTTLFSVISEPPDTGPSVISAMSRSTVTQNISIPPTVTPLLAAPLPAPVMVTPAAAGVAAAARLTLVRPPHMPDGPLPGVLRLPTGSGPFPAVILLHGCNGPFKGMPDWAYRLNAWGYAALMPDSMTPRGVKSVCDTAEQSKLTPGDRVGDVGAAAAWLRTRSEIDPARIAVLGLSHGGATAALSAQAPYGGMRLRAAVDYYGTCAEPRLHGSVPLLVLAGEADEWGDPAKKCRAYGQALRSDQPFEIYTYPGVFHAFDSGPRTKTVFKGHAMAYDRTAAEDSFIRVRTFLDRQVKN